LLNLGLFDLPWWGYVVVALVFTHITIAGVTIYLHRNQCHRGLDLHPVVSHFFRFWLFLTTGMNTKEWVAIHRKHHARCETEEDPHSPQILGLSKVLWEGAELYRDESEKPETLAKYGKGTPDDWIERNLYTPRHNWGVIAMLITDLVLFGPIGLTIWAVQMIWIPFWAAGVINGVAHYWGYRTFQAEDASRNIIPWGIIIGGEELHNNHHAYPSSAKFSNQWYEFDIGWVYIRALEFFGLATVKRVAPKIVMSAPKEQCDQQTLQAIITHRYDVLAKFATQLKSTCAEEIGRLRGRVHLPEGRLPSWSGVKHWLHLDAAQLPESARAPLQQMLTSSKVLATVYAMRQELATLWGKSNLSHEQLLKQLNDWCHRAEASGIKALHDFSRHLRSYAQKPHALAQVSA
jgi:stearoyl-CoA desaturase (Delta-9 desaturase)